MPATSDEPMKGKASAKSSSQAKKPAAAAKPPPSAAEWAAQRKAKIEAAKAKKEEAKLGEVTQEHTFMPTKSMRAQKMASMKSKSDASDESLAGDASRGMSAAGSLPPMPESVERARRSLSKESPPAPAAASVPSSREEPDLLLPTESSLQELGSTSSLVITSVAEIADSSRRSTQQPLQCLEEPALVGESSFLQASDLPPQAPAEAAIPLPSPAKQQAVPAEEPQKVARDQHAARYEASSVAKDQLRQSAPEHVASSIAKARVDTEELPGCSVPIAVGVVTADTLDIAAAPAHQRPLPQGGLPPQPPQPAAAPQVATAAIVAVASASAPSSPLPHPRSSTSNPQCFSWWDLASHGVTTPACRQFIAAQRHGFHLPSAGHIQQVESLTSSSHMLQQVSNTQTRPVAAGAAAAAAAAVAAAAAGAAGTQSSPLAAAPAAEARRSDTARVPGGAPPRLTDPGSGMPSLALPGSPQLDKQPAREALAAPSSGGAQSKLADQLSGKGISWGESAEGTDELKVQPVLSDMSSAAAAAPSRTFRSEDSGIGLPVNLAVISEPARPSALDRPRATAAAPAVVATAAAQTSLAAAPQPQTLLAAAPQPQASSAAAPQPQDAFAAAPQPQASLAEPQPQASLAALLPRVPAAVQTSTTALEETQPKPLQVSVPALPQVAVAASTTVTTSTSTTTTAAQTADLPSTSGELSPRPPKAPDVPGRSTPPRLGDPPSSVDVSLEAKPSQAQVELQQSTSYRPQGTSKAGTPTKSEQTQTETDAASLENAYQPAPAHSYLPAPPQPQPPSQPHPPPASEEDDGTGSNHKKYRWWIPFRPPPERKDPPKPAAPAAFQPANVAPSGPSPPAPVDDKQPPQKKSDTPSPEKTASPSTEAAPQSEQEGQVKDRQEAASVQSAVAAPLAESEAEARQANAAEVEGANRLDPVAEGDEKAEPQKPPQHDEAASGASVVATGGGAASPPLTSDTPQAAEAVAAVASEEQRSSEVATPAPAAEGGAAAAGAAETAAADPPPPEVPAEAAAAAAPMPPPSPPSEQPQSAEQESAEKPSAEAQAPVTNADGLGKVLLEMEDFSGRMVAASEAQAELHREHRLRVELLEKKCQELEQQLDSARQLEVAALTSSDAVAEEAIGNAIEKDASELPVQAASAEAGTRGEPSTPPRKQQDGDGKLSIEVTAISPRRQPLLHRLLGSAPCLPGYEKDMSVSPASASSSMSPQERRAGFSGAAAAAEAALAAAKAAFAAVSISSDRPRSRTSLSSQSSSRSSQDATADVAATASTADSEQQSVATPSLISLPPVPASVERARRSLSGSGSTLETVLEDPQAENASAASPDVNREVAAPAGEAQSAENRSADPREQPQEAAVPSLLATAPSPRGLAISAARSRAELAGLAQLRQMCEDLAKMTDSLPKEEIDRLSNLVSRLSQVVERKPPEMVPEEATQ